ncbi:MAG: bifunctional lysylphosphatidylglycerol flippase/synthetase MprF, partial [Acidimicrobiales bacterium]
MATADGLPEGAGVLAVPDVLEVAVPVGGRVLIFGDAHLGVPVTPSSEQVAGEVARALGAATGPGTVVVVGDLFELVAAPNTDVDGVLRAHPRLRDALASYTAGRDHHLVVLPGAHDAALGWDDRERTVVERQLGARVALAVDLFVATGAGERHVRVEPGHQLDAALGHHVARDVLPVARRAGAEWLVGIDHLVDPADVAGFVRSRLLYRRLARRLALLAVPFVVALIGLLGWLATDHPGGGVWRAIAIDAALVGVGLVATVALGGLWWAWAVRRPIASLSRPVEPNAAPAPGGPVGAARRRDRNAAPRRRAIELMAGGWTGYVSGHTQKPELADLGGGFYANAGGLGEVVEHRRGRFGLPGAYAVGRRLSWLELAAGPELTAQLRWGRQALPTTTVLERLATRPVVGGEPRPTVVGQWPDGNPWPERAGDPRARRVRVRRQAAALLALLGIIDLLSAITPPLEVSLRLLGDVMPIEVPQTAAVLVVLAGISLLMLSRGVRRGQRHAWMLAVSVLVATAVLHLVKGLDVAEYVTSLALAVYLAANRDHFRARVDESSARRSATTLAVGALTAIGAGLLAVLTYGHRGRPPLGDAVLAVAERMIGLTTIALPHRVDRFLQPTLLAATAGLGLAAGWLLFRPVLAKTLDARPPESIEAARRIVERSRGDTLAYFALRDDKRFWFFGDSMVAYAVIGGVALVSPDPLGPPAERHDVWAGFVAFADDHGWSVAVMGAGDAWLSTYRAAGMHDIYVGDEAVVDVRRFDLAGGRNKGLRQAVNRVAKKGYRTEFHDPSDMAPELEAKLRELMTESRRGEVERGFSMTLGRIFDPADTGLLLTVCFGPDAEPVAFCQFVPAPAIDGYSLDLMRRSEGEHPNGLTDFVVVETIRHLRATGKVGLGLNFATMRAVLAGERGDTSFGRIQRWLLGRMGDSMQIESLWRFNAKFDPDWVPRYAV